MDEVINPSKNKGLRLGRECPWLRANSWRSPATMSMVEPALYDLTNLHLPDFYGDARYPVVYWAKWGPVLPSYSR